MKQTLKAYSIFREKNIGGIYGVVGGIYGFTTNKFMHRGLLKALGTVIASTLEI